MESHNPVRLGGEVSSAKGMESNQIDFLEEKQVPSQGWRVKRHEGWKEKQVQPTGWSVTRLEGWEDKQVLYTD